MSTIVRSQLSVITICRPLSHSLVTSLTCLIHTSLLSPTLRYSIRACPPKGEENEETKERGNINVTLCTKENRGSGCRAPPTAARHPVMGQTQLKKMDSTSPSGQEQPIPLQLSAWPWPVCLNPLVLECWLVSLVQILHRHSQLLRIHECTGHATSRRRYFTANF